MLLSVDSMTPIHDAVADLASVHVFLLLVISNVSSRLALASVSSRTSDTLSAECYVWLQSTVSLAARSG